MQIWSTEEKAQPVRQTKLEAAETPTAACYSRDGACIALGTASGAILILDTFRLAVLAVLRDAHIKRVSPLFILKNSVFTKARLASCLAAIKHCIP